LITLGDDCIRQLDSLDKQLNDKIQLQNLKDEIFNVAEALGEDMQGLEDILEDYPSQVNIMLDCITEM